MSRPPGATVGGQAVLEGVMMRASTGWAVAIRRSDGAIEAMSHSLPRMTSRSRLTKLLFIRGVLVLAESLSLGFKALAWSAQKSGDENEVITRWQVVSTLTVAVVVALAIFIAIPVFAASWLQRFMSDSSLGFVMLDGIIRLTLIVSYIWLVSRSKEIRRVFQYHGAEHKTIHAYENGDPLSIDTIQSYSPRHPRCGTSFLLIVAMVAFVVFLMLAPLSFFWQVAIRLALIPVIAGLSYEVLKIASRKSQMAWMSRPGIWLQSITTQEPEDAMVEVAIVSLLAALDDDERAVVTARGSIPEAVVGAEYNLDDLADG